MIKNPILFIIDNNGDYLRHGGTLRAINGYREFAFVISPRPLTDSVSMSIMTNNANYNRFEQYVLPTAIKVNELIEESDALYQTIADWNVFGVEIKPTALADISNFRSGATTFSFQFQTPQPSVKCVTYKGVFGVDNPLPTIGRVSGDYYECEDWNFYLTSGTQTYTLTKGMYVYFNGSRWIKDALLVELNTSTVSIPVEPSHAVGDEIDDDDVNYLASIGAAAILAQQTAEQSAQDISEILDGTQTVKRSEQDASGNVITTTYETKADATSKKSEIDGRLDIAESDIDAAEGDIDTLQSTKVPKTTTIIGLDLQDNILIGEFRTALGNATQSVAGLLSAEDKTHLDGLVALLETSDGDTIVDTIGEILEIFQNYPEGADLVTVLQGKVDKVVGKELSTNDLTDVLKGYYDTAYNHSQVLNSNPHKTKYTQLEDKPTTLVDLGVLDLYDRNYIDALKDQNGWESELITLTPLTNGQTVSTATLLTFNSLRLQVKDTSTSFVDTDTVEVSLGVVTGNKIQLSDTSVYLEIGTTNSTFIAPANWQLQIVGLAYTELKAVETTYDNITSGLDAENVQEAIDELEANKAIDFSVVDDTKYPTTKAVSERLLNLPIAELNNHTLREVFEDGNYLLDKNVINGTYYSNSGGVASEVNSQRYNEYFDVSIGDYIYINKVNVLIVNYDISNNFISRQSITSYIFQNASAENIRLAQYQQGLLYFDEETIMINQTSLGISALTVSEMSYWFKIYQALLVSDTNAMFSMFASKTLEAWLTPTLTTATTTYLKYRKDNFGVVAIEGNITVATAGTNLTLPTGYRPLFAYTVGILTFNTNGTVVSSATGTQTLSVRFTGGA